MRLRHWLAPALSFGFMLAAPAFVFAEDAAPAPQLPQACVDAGAATQADCDAVLAKQKAEAEKAAADKAAADQAAADKAAADKAAAAQAEADKAAAAQAEAEKKASEEKAAADKAAADQAAADKAAADKAAAEQAKAEKKAAAEKAAEEKAAAAKAAEEKAAAETAAADKAAADKAAADKAAADQAAGDKAAADKAAADKAAADQAAADKAAADKTAADQAAGDKAAADKAAADKAAADKAAADKAAADKAAADKAAADQAAGDKAATDKAAADKAAADQAAADKAAADKAAADKAAADAAAGKPAEQAKPLPAEVTPAKPVEQTVEPVKTAPALPNIEPGLTAAAKAYNKSAGILAKPDADKGAADKARADIKAQQAQIDALCKSNNFDSSAQCLAQFGIQLASVPAADGGKPAPVQTAQPVEVINNLPKGVTKEDVAPLLDSAKDVETGKASVPQEGQKPPATPVANTPPPTNDKAAQAGLKPGKITPIDQSKGEAIDPKAQGGQVGVPQNVTIINQTVVNNTTNVTTNNTQVNNGPGVQQNNTGVAVEQNNGNNQGKPGNGKPGGNRPGNGGPGNGPGNGGPGPQQEPNPIGLGLQVILQIGNQLIINSPAQDQRRIANRPDDNTDYERLSGNRYRETVTRPNGVRIVTIYNRNGDILRRSRFDKSGRETVLAYFDDRYDNDLANWRDPGDDLPPLRLRIPARDYVLDADEADEADVQRFFAQPPVEQVQRLYSIDEVKRSARIRDMVRRLEVGDLTFDTGAATISEDQVGNLSKVAKAMIALLKKNPAETFLIEGHTDAVGSDIANLRLSDERAATVAQILTDFYHIPPENLATQGYGERFLKVQTDLAEPLNRRVTIRRITSLVTLANR